MIADYFVSFSDVFFLVVPKSAAEKLELYPAPAYCYRSNSPKQAQGSRSKSTKLLSANHTERIKGKNYSIYRKMISIADVLLYVIFFSNVAYSRIGNTV